MIYQVMCTCCSGGKHLLMLLLANISIEVAKVQACPTLVHGKGNTV